MILNLLLVSLQQSHLSFDLIVLFLSQLIHTKSIVTWLHAELFTCFSGLQECKEWLKSLPVQNAILVECGSLTLNTAQINEVQSAINQLKRVRTHRNIDYVNLSEMQTTTDPGKTQKLKVKPSMIFKVLLSKKEMYNREGPGYNMGYARGVGQDVT